MKWTYTNQTRTTVYVGAESLDKMSDSDIRRIVETATRTMAERLDARGPVWRYF